MAINADDFCLAKSKADNVLKYDGAGVSTVRTFTLAGCTTGILTWENGGRSDVLR